CDSCVYLIFHQPWVVGHNRSRTHTGGLVHMVVMPAIRILAADTCQIRTRTLAAPLERVVVDKLTSFGILSIPGNLMPERTDHLTMTGITAFAHIYIPSV